MMTIINNIFSFISKLFSFNKRTQTSTCKIKALCVGVENGFAGKCPGTLKDATRMHELLGKYSSERTLLLDSKATKEKVVECLEKCVDADLLVFYYSGHGGQLNSSAHPEFEIDGKDEYLCLFDQPFIDDDLWDIISKAKKSFIMFDCCHSQTMFRTAENQSPIVQREGIQLSGIEQKAKNDPNMLVWSGCPDNTYSYGDSSGGKFTNCFLANFKPEQTYEEMWTKIKNDKDLSNYEDTQQTIIGKSFTNQKMFEF